MRPLQSVFKTKSPARTPGLIDERLNTLHRSP
jgi:hypothetical protein